MYQKLVKVNVPRIFFKHELEQLSEPYCRAYRPGYIPQYFTFIDENGEFADKVLYEPYGLNDKHIWGINICVMKRCEEERYSQSIIDSCRKHHKEHGTKQYEWHLVKRPVVINTVTGECVFAAKRDMDYVYVYDNLIYYSAHYGDGGKQILNWLGDVIVDNIQDMFETKTHLIVKKNHDYSTGIDTVICINKLTGNIDKEY